MAELVIKLVNGELAGKTMQALSKDVSEATREFKKAEIGTQAYVDASKKLNDASARMADAKKQAQSLSTASDSLKNSFSGILNLIPGFSSISGFLGQAKTGVGGLTSGFGLLRGAIAATGFGLLIIAVGGLIGAFSKFTPLMDYLERVLSGISAVVSEVINRVQNFGTAIWGIIDGSTSLTSGIEKASKSFDGMRKSMGDAYDAGVELKRLEQDLEDAARGLDIANAKAERQVEKLIIQSKNKNLTDKQSIDVLKEARIVAEENFKRNDEQKQKEFDALIQKAKIQSKLSKEEIIQLTEGTLAYQTEKEKRGSIEDSLLDKIKNAQIERINSAGQTGKLLEKINNAESLQQQQRQQAIEKSNDEAQKIIQNELAIEQNIRRLNNEKILSSIDDEREKEIAKLDIETNDKIGHLKGSADQILTQTTLLKEIQADQLESINKKYAIKQIEEDKKISKDALDQRLSDNELELATELNHLNEMHLAGTISQEDYVTQSSQLTIRSEAKKLNILKSAFGEQSKEYQSAYSDFLKLQQSTSDQGVANIKKITENQKQALIGSLATFGNVFGSLAGMYEQGTAQWKAFAVAQAIISTISGAINAYSSTSAIPVIGPILAPIAAGAALASGYAQVRKIEQTKMISPTKAESGMVLVGPSHSNGGIPIEAEGDEIILTKGVYRNPSLRSLASQINVAGGGRSFASGGPTNPFDISRGAVASIEGPVYKERSQDILEMKQAFLAYANKVDTWATQLQVHNNVLDTAKGIQVHNNIKSEANT